MYLTLQKLKTPGRVGGCVCVWREGGQKRGVPKCMERERDCMQNFNTSSVKYARNVADVVY